MSTVDTIDRKDEHSMRRIVVLLAALLLVVAVLVGWSRLGAGERETAEVLGEVFTGRSTGNNGKSTPGQGQGSSPGNGQPAPPGGNPRTFGISGNLEEIYPTFDGTLEVTFTNPHRFEIVVTQLNVALASASGDCDVELLSGVFTIDDELPTEGVLVDPRRGNTDGTGSVDIDFDVSNDLPDECQREQIGFVYTGTAVRVNQP